MEEKQITLEIIELQTGHYYSLFHALAAAMTRCMTWRNEENKEAKNNDYKRWKESKHNRRTIRR